MSKTQCYACKAEIHNGVAGLQCPSCWHEGGKYIQGCAFIDCPEKCESFGRDKGYRLKDPLDAPKADKDQALHYDSGKPSLALLPNDGLLEVAKVLDFGAKKYAAFNWVKGMDWMKLANSTLRHVFAWVWGETIDPESGINHLAHACADLLFLLTYAKRGLGKDDRYKKAA